MYVPLQIESGFIFIIITESFLTGEIYIALEINGYKSHTTNIVGNYGNKLIFY